MYLDYGTSSGLAYRHNFQQDIANDQRNEMLDRQARIDAENKTKLFADEFKFGEAQSDYNKNQLKQYTEQLIPKIGKFVNDNPDYRTNTMKYSMYKQMTGGLLKNKFVENDMRFQGMKKELAAHLAKHPEDVDRPEIAKMAEQISNYNKTGDIEGKTGQDRQFDFLQPKPYVDLDVEAQKDMGGFSAFEYRKADPSEASLLGEDAVFQKAKQKELNAKTMAYYERNKSQLDNQAKKAGYNTGEDYARDLIKSQVPEKYITPPRDYLSEQEQLLKLKSKYKNQESKSADPFEKDVVNKKYGSVNPDVMQGALGTRVPAAYIAFQDLSKPAVELRGVKFNNNGNFDTKDNKYPIEKLRNKKVVTGEVDMPIEWAAGQGIFAPDAKLDELEDGVVDISPDNSSIARVVTVKGPDGKESKVVRFHAYTSVDPNNLSAKMGYNKKAEPTKLISGESSIPEITSNDQYDSLPVGSQYKDSSGVIRTKD